MERTDSQWGAISLFFNLKRKCKLLLIGVSITPSSSNHTFVPNFICFNMTYDPKAIGLKTSTRALRRSGLLLLFLFPALFLYGQTAPHFIKTDIGDSGTQIYLPGKPDPIAVSYAQDSSVVYTIETVDSTSGDLYHFGCIVVNLNGVDLTGQEEDILISYMDYLQSAFEIESSAGYGKGHILSTHPSAKGVLDYWEDADQTHWIVKGWAAESTLFVMFIYGPEDYPNQNIVDVFFNGARFKGD